MQSRTVWLMPGACGGEAGGRAGEAVVLARGSAPANTHHSSRAAPPFAGVSVSAHVRAAVPGRSERPCPLHSSALPPPSPACRVRECKKKMSDTHVDQWYTWTLARFNSEVCNFCATSITVRNCKMNVFKRVSWSLPLSLVRQSDNPAPNLRHWLSQRCCAGLDQVAHTNRTMLWF